MPTQEKRVTIENADYAFINFSGEERRYNAAGDRNFCVFLPEDLADRMRQDGWNIKMYTPRDEDDGEEREQDRPYIQVSVGFKAKPPVIVMIAGEGADAVHTPLNEGSVDLLDAVDIEYMDVVIRGYEWSVNGESGVKAYVKTLYVKIFEDDIQKKHRQFVDDTLGEDVYG